MAPIKDQLRKARTAAGLTREKLAQKLNVSLTTIVRWETGKTIPNAEVFQRIQALAQKEAG